MNKIFYLTTPLYYVNARPHIGHAYTNVLADTYARFHRFRGEEVFFLTGTDEHGGKIEKTAREAGLSPRDYVDSMVPQFKQLWERLDIRYDDFIRTTEERHQKVVHSVLKTLYESGDIFLGKYRGWYCTPCESFWVERELVEGACRDCGRPVEVIEEDNYFFKLSHYQDWLIEHIRTHAEFIFPPSRRNEILSFLGNPLEDLCISRPRSRLAWGIPFPFSAAHVVYVWFDALINYISAAGFGEDSRFSKIWPADLHWVGKDILRQHVVYWPIMLKAIGCPIPKTVVAHGWWTMEGAKVSKSRGNIVDPLEAIEQYGRDTLRYFLLREVTLGLDGSYSDEILRARFETDLANDLGNLVHRSSGMLERYFKGEIPAVDPLVIDHPLKKRAIGLWPEVERKLESYDPKGALEAIWDLVVEANRSIEIAKPWVLAKEKETEKLSDFLYALFETLRFLSLLLSFFMPETSGKILQLLDPESHLKISPPALKSWGLLRPGSRIGRSVPLFPKGN